MPRPDRRHVILGALAAGGGLVLGVRLETADAQKAGSKADRVRQRRAETRHHFNAWIVIRPDETVIVRVARSEMGQGTLTGLAQLAAEELDCRWVSVTAELVAPHESHGRQGAWGEFATGASRSIRGAHVAMRQAGLAARLMLLQAAARQWDVPVETLTTREGVVWHAPTRRSATFGRLAEAAARLPAPTVSELRLKDRAAWHIAGKPVASLGAHAKVTGDLVFGTDVRLPGLLNAAIRQPPVPGQRLVRFDAALAEAMPGVRRVVALGDEAVVVIADGWWQAETALGRLATTWSAVPEATSSSDSIASFVASGLATEEAFVGRTHGDALGALRGSAKTLDAVYATPFLHHATLEPMNATALWQADSCEVWAPTQNAEAAWRTAAEAAGLEPEKVRVHRTAIGGAFGRRLKQDYVRFAVLAARAMPGVPVKLMWSREEDTAHGFYRPVTQAKLSGGLDARGEPTGLIMRLSGQSILASNLAGSQGHGATSPGRDPRMFQGLYAQPGEAQMGYSFPSVYIDHAMRNTHVPVGSWRGVHTTQNGVYLECFVDEMADAAGRDPLDFRRGMMKGHPRHLAVLEAAARRAGWEAAPADGIFRGLAQIMAVGSYAAVVVEVRRAGDGEGGVAGVRVTRVVAALDCGHVVNPRLVEAQVEGAVTLGLSTALYEEITIREGRVVQQNLDAYRVLRLAEMPPMEVALVPSGEFWGGVGDAVIGAVAPALLNAVFRATGRRIRRLPLARPGPG